MVTKSKKALLASLTAFLCVMLTVFGLSVLSVSSSGTAKADGESAAKIGDTSYATLEEAIGAAKDNDTIELLGDVAVDSQLVINKAVTLNLGGHTLTSNTAKSYAIVLNAKTTITNGTIIVGNAQAIAAKAEMTMSSVTLDNTLDGYYATVALSASDTAYSIANCTIDGSYSLSNFANNATVTIADSTITGRGNTFYHNGSYYGLKLTVTNSNITSTCTDGCGVYISGSESTQKDEKNQNGVGGRQQATFTKCTISGTNGIEAKYTDLTLNSCTVSTTAESPSYTQNNNGPAASGFAVVATDNAVNGVTPVPSGSIVVKGDGKYTGPVGLGMLESIKTDFADFKDESIRISGGTFHVEVPEEYCEMGYVPQDNGDGTYGVAKTNVAELNGTEYETLQAAIDAVTSKTSGKTIKLIANTRENVTVSNYPIVLDLNGYTLNGGTEKGKPTILVNNKKVTIKDSSKAQTGTVMREDTAANSGITSHYVIDIQGDKAFIIEGGNFKNDNSTASLIRLGDDSYRNKKPTLTINGGTFTQNNAIVIKVDYGTLYFRGGELNSSNSYAIENYHTAYVEGGTINGVVSSWVYSDGIAFSKLTIRNNAVINGDVRAINFKYAEDDTNQARVYVEGGTINGTLGTYLYNGEYTETEADKATIEVTAGTFSKDPRKYVTEGSTITPDENGKYGVAKVPLAEVNGTKYYTMDEAYTAQKTSGGKEIVLLRDYTSNDVFNSGSINRTVNLNGFTWTYTGTDIDCAAFEVNYSDVVLTVKNGKIVSSQLVGLIPSAMSGSITYDNAEISFESVVMTANGHSGIETNGNNTNDRITLKDSTLNVPNGFGIYFPSSGMLTIENSVINAKTMGVQVCSGSLNISGDKTAINVTGNAVPKTENDGAIQDGAAISIVGRAGYKGLVKAEIAGGTFTSADGNAIKAYEWANKEESEFDNSASIVEVTGGVFSGKVDKDLLRCGYILNTVGGNSTVKEGKGFTEVRVVLNESLAMKLMLDEAVTSNYVVVTYTSLEDGNAKTVTLNDHGDYYLFDKIMPQMIDVKFTFELYGDDGVMLDRIANYSIIDYLGNVLKTNAGSTEAFKNLAASLIEYANKAKAVKGLASVAPVFTDVNGETIELNYTAFVEANKIPAKETASSVSTGSVQAIYKAKVVFDNAYTLYFYANTAIATNYTYKLDGKEIAFDENGVYSVTVKASEITHGYTIEVYGEDKTTPVQTVTYGVSIYSVRMQNEATPYGELYVATYYYGVAVNKYAGA